MRNILKRLFRVYGHIYHSHFRQAVARHGMAAGARRQPAGGERRAPGGRGWQAGWNTGDICCVERWSAHVCQQGTAIPARLPSAPPCPTLPRPPAHWCRQVEKLELEPHLNTCFRHFMLFTLVSAGTAGGVGGGATRPRGLPVHALGRDRRAPTLRCTPARCSAAQLPPPTLPLHPWVPPSLRHSCHISACPPPLVPSPTAPSQEFNLIDERELAPLKELIDRMVR